MENEWLGKLPEGAEFVRFLNEIERQVRPDTFRIKAFNYWPIIRFALNGKRAGKVLKGEGKLPQVGPLRRAKICVKELFGSGKHKELTYPRDYFAQLPSADVLFLNRDTQYNNNLRGYSIQYFTDGLRSLAGEKVKCTTLVNRDPRETGEQFWVDTVLLPKMRSGRSPKLLVPSGKAELADRNRVIAKISETNAAIARLGVDHQVNEKYILQRIDRTVALVSFFGLVFRRVRPKVIFLSSFTGAYHVCAAAKPLGIKVVDIQHGGMHQNHPLAANWTNVPVNGYELLPDFFWCWTDRTAAYVNPSFACCHEAFAGGNPKAAFEKTVFEGCSSENKPSRHKPRVLVALQYGKSALVAPHVMEAYEATKEKVEWRFRLHPRGFDRLEEASRSLRISREDILSASERPLHQIFPETTFLLTDASTIVYEALDHGIRPAVWSEKGGAFFDDLLQSGELKLLSCADHVVDFVTSDTRSLPSRSKRSGGKDDESELALIKFQFDRLLSD